LIKQNELKKHLSFKNYERFLFFKQVNIDQNSFLLLFCCKNVTVPFHCDCALVVQKMFGKNFVKERKKKKSFLFSFFKCCFIPTLDKKAPLFFFPHFI